MACGTNNAGAQDLGRMEYCIEMIRECGLTWRDMWVPPADGQKAIQRKPLLVSRRVLIPFAVERFQHAHERGHRGNSDQVEQASTPSQPRHALRAASAAAKSVAASSASTDQTNAPA